MDHFTLVDPDPCFLDDIIELNLNFTSGELLISDWFRLDEFTSVVDEQNKFNLSSSKGRSDSTKRYADLFNFAFIHLGNNSPSVFQSNDSLVVDMTDGAASSKKRYKMNDLPCEEVGSICTDLWGAAIIDKQQLLYILETKLGNDATKALDDYIASNDVLQVKVSPGEYTLRFGGKYWTFNTKSKLEKEPHMKSNGIEQFFTLTKTTSNQPQAKPRFKF